MQECTELQWESKRRGRKIRGEKARHEPVAGQEKNFSATEASVKMPRWCFPYLPESTVKSVTVRAVEELGVFGGLKKLNFFFDSVILSSVSSDGPTWYLQRPQKNQSICTAEWIHSCRVLTDKCTSVSGCILPRVCKQTEYQWTSVPPRHSDQTVEPWWLKPGRKMESNVISSP